MNFQILLILLISISIVKVQDIQENTKYTAIEIKALKQFRYVLGDDENNIFRTDFMKSDEYLIKWLRANNVNINKAYAMLQRNLEWRKKENIDNILNENFKNLEQALPYDLEGVDLEGNPVIQFDIGHWNVHRVSYLGKIKEIKRYFDQMIEKGMDKIQKLRTDNTENGNNNNNNNVMNHFSIIANFDGYKSREHGCFQCLLVYANLVRDIEQFYPGTLKNIIFINSPPRIADIAFTFMTRPINYKRSKNIVKIFRKNKDEMKSRSIISKLISSDQLLIELGGTKRSNLDNYD